MSALAFKPLMGTALRSPRDAARAILDARIPDAELWWMLVLGAILSVLPTYVFLYFGTFPDDTFAEMMRQAFPFPPFVAAMLQFGQAAIGVFVVHWVGSAFGAVSSRKDVLGVLAILQLVSLVLIYGITVIGLVIPILTAFAFLIFICWWFYAIIAFVDEAYGFASPFKTSLILIGALVATLILSALALSLAGSILIGIVGAN